MASRPCAAVERETGRQRQIADPYLRAGGARPAELQHMTARLYFAPLDGIDLFDTRDTLSS
jgi:hypothetical protein